MQIENNEINPCPFNRIQVEVLKEVTNTISVTTNRVVVHPLVLPHKFIISWIKIMYLNLERETRYDTSHRVVTHLLGSLERH
jgi:hypothetical protein